MNIKNRNPITAILLSIVTCGIYGIYWTYCMAKEALSVGGEDDLLTIILCIFFPFIGFFLLEKKFAAALEAKGIAHTDNSILYLVLCLIFPIATYYLFQTELNKLAD